MYPLNQGERTMTNDEAIEIVDHILSFIIKPNTNLKEDNKKAITDDLLDIRNHLYERDKRAS